MALSSSITEKIGQNIYYFYLSIFIYIDKIFATTVFLLINAPGHEIFGMRGRLIEENF